MTLIRFESANINSVQDKFKQESSELLQEIEKFHKELYEITTILNTPQSSKLIPEQIEILEKMEEYIRKQNIYFDSVFNIAKNEYSDFEQKIKSMVGDVNE